MDRAAEGPPSPVPDEMRPVPDEMRPVPDEMRPVPVKSGARPDL